MKKKYIIILVGVLVLVALDQITKYYIVNNMNLGESFRVIKNFFAITSRRNDGGAWSILSGNMTIFYFITLLAFVLFFYLSKDVDFTNKKIYSIAFILLIAGTIGNFIDRLLFQEVVDFLDFYIFGYDFPVFNVADMCLVIGVFMFGYDVLKEEVLHGKVNS
ncbi:MAG: signal peptidase II [Firmicutes bacterium]|nr:signal peptidase II [Bacillota bacterium]